MKRLAIVLCCLCCASSAFADAKKDALIEAMNQNGCQMTTAQANITMPALGISRPEAIRMSREMMAAGIATFGADQETLILLPPACKN